MRRTHQWAAGLFPGWLGAPRRLDRCGRLEGPQAAGPLPGDRRVQCSDLQEPRPRWCGWRTKQFVALSTRHRHNACTRVQPTLEELPLRPGRPPDPARRQQLLDAVADELVTAGIPASSLRRLAERLGVAPNTLEHHFGSKEKLLAEALAVLRAREVDRVARALGFITVGPGTAGDDVAPDALGSDAPTDAAGSDGSLGSDGRSSTRATGPTAGQVDAAAALAIAWEAIADPRALGAGCVLFEIWGLALRYRHAHRDFLDHVVEDWVGFARLLLGSAGVAEHRVEGLATVAVAGIRGLLLDLLTSGESARSRVDAGLAELCALIEQASAGSPP